MLVQISLTIILRSTKSLIKLIILLNENCQLWYTDDSCLCYFAEVLEFHFTFHHLVFWLNQNLVYANLSVLLWPLDNTYRQIQLIFSMIWTL